MLCPVCSAQIGEEEANEHVNNCLDAIESEKSDETPGEAGCGTMNMEELDSVTSELPRELEEDDWVVLDDQPFKGSKPPPRFRSPFGIRDKIRRTISRSFLMQDQGTLLRTCTPIIIHHQIYPPLQTDSCIYPKRPMNRCLHPYGKAIRQ